LPASRRQFESTIWASAHLVDCVLDRGLRRRRRRNVVLAASRPLRHLNCGWIVGTAAAAANRPVFSMNEGGFPVEQRGLVNRVVREVMELTHGEAVKNGVSLLTELADSTPLIPGDRIQLQQVMLNLIINAVEAMSGVGNGARELLITTGKTASGDVLVAVRDSGPGLALAALERVFDPFYTSKPGGLGMGLSICRSIIEAHGGRLWASANVTRGATFQFTVPT